jgi:hypothetical protein
MMQRSVLVRLHVVERLAAAGDPVLVTSEAPVVEAVVFPDGPSAPSTGPFPIEVAAERRGQHFSDRAGLSALPDEPIRPSANGGIECVCEAIVWLCAGIWFTVSVWYSVPPTWPRS